VHHKSILLQITNVMQLEQSYLLFTARSLYMFRVLSAPIIRSTQNCRCNHRYKSRVGVV